MYRTASLLQACIKICNYIYCLLSLFHFWRQKILLWTKRRKPEWSRNRTSTSTSSADDSLTLLAVKQQVQYVLMKNDIPCGRSKSQPVFHKDKLHIVGEEQMVFILALCSDMYKRHMSIPAHTHTHIYYLVYVFYTNIHKNMI